MAADPDQAYLQYLVEEERRGEPVQIVYVEDVVTSGAAAQ